MAELKRLEAKRKIYINEIVETYNNAVRANRDQSCVDQFRVRFGDVETFVDQFYVLHNEIIGLLTTDAEFEVQEKLRKDTIQFYYDSKVIFNSLCNSPAEGRMKVQSSVKLPALSIPMFRGDQKLWPTFSDLYLKLIHENDELSNIEKFQYLLSYLGDEPLKLLSGIAVTDSNYEIAYNKLVKRYRNKRLLATIALSSIFSVSYKNESAKELRSLLNTFSESLAVLNSLGFNTDDWDFILFSILLEKLDMGTRTNFEIQSHSTEIPEYAELFRFLEKRCEALESVQHIGTHSSKQMVLKSPNNTSGGQKTGRKFAFHQTTCDTRSRSKLSCYLCKEAHILSKCPRFLERSPQERMSYAQQRKLCLNCLHHAHQLQECGSRFRCRTCQLRHHSSLHFPNESQVALGNNLSDSGPISESTNVANACEPQSTVLLATAVVHILDGARNYQPIRVLIDSGSQSNFVTDKCVQRLRLPRTHLSTTIYGLNEMSSFSSKGLAHCVVRPMTGSEPVLSFEAIIVPKLCSDMPSFDLQEPSWEYLSGLDLADKTFYLSRGIDLLLGADLFVQLLRSGRITGGAGLPSAVETVFGWVLLGQVNHNEGKFGGPSNFMVYPRIPLELTLPKFWEIEQIPDRSFQSPEDMECERLYQKTVRRDPTGRYTVSLPFKGQEPDLGDTYFQAYRRFLNLENRLQKNPSIYASYCDFMKDYMDSGHMSILRREETRPLRSCYLPHHCVVKPDSVSTKLRVVWDASAKGPKGISLNDTLLPGPKLQKDIFSLLLLFRFHPVVFIADIKQMFRQILVQPSHRQFQRILWRFSPQDPLSHWQLNTVTFGMSCSPFLAMRTLNELAEVEQRRFPEASKLIKSQIYMDDILGTCHSVEEALKLQKELIELLQAGGFELRKWASNCSELLDTVPAADRQMPLVFDKDEPHFLKVLGLQWHPYSDTFSYECKPLERSCTKRTILSDIGRIFDPLGFLSPVLLLAKHIMQRLWCSHVDWDEKPPENIFSAWNKLKTELPELSRVSLSRRAVVSGFQRCELHGFCDASNNGYAAVIYFRVETHNNISLFLVCAKGRVAPLKSLSIPKLELCAAKLLADLILSVKKVYSFMIFSDICAWSDSQVALSWINSSPSRWKPFVANRVACIQEIISFDSWRYVPSDQNPADCASRGMTPAELLSFDLWWKGPAFLFSPRTEWNITSKSSPSELLTVRSEERRVVLGLTAESHFIDALLDKFSSLSKILRVVAYCLRFSTFFRSCTAKQSGAITQQELNTSVLRLIGYVQHSVFSDLIAKLNKSQLLPKPFRKLAIFLDKEGLLRVGGRIRRSELPFESKHPLLLPSSHRLSYLIIEDVHRKYLHPGLNCLRNLIVQQYWILSSRRAIRKVLSNCYRCFRASPKFYPPPGMADLPSFRVLQVKPFSHVAVDFCGPFSVTVYRTRGAKVFKSYVCVFVCTSTKAIHLELTQELSTDDFIAAFRRFISRRGSVVACYSDNGTNFVGANSQFVEWANQAAEKLNLKWHFGPPSGPHFNGLAEAGVKMVKAHMYRVVGDQRLTFQEFSTLLCQIESVLNSRPLGDLSSDPNDLTPLTPSHFLILEPPNACIPDPSVSELEINRLSRWQLVQRLHQDFWKRYATEYLNTLQQRSKWLRESNGAQLNDLVLIKSDFTSPFKWSLGRIAELHPGEDGNVRVVTVRTAKGLLKRPVVKLCPLPKF